MAYKDYNKKMSEYMLRRYHRRREEALARLGGECTVCGAKENLEIDHVDPDQKVIALNKMWSIAEERFLKELAKCQLLCKTHHEEKSANEHGKERAKGQHGTLSSHRYCRCLECKAAKAAYMREYQKSRRLGA